MLGNEQAARRAKGQRLLIPLVVVIVGAMLWVNSNSMDYPPPAHWEKILSLTTAATSGGDAPSGFMEQEAVTAIGALAAPVKTEAEGDRGDGRVRYVLTGSQGRWVMVVLGEDTLEILEITREDE
jgi:hypothetical protein